MTTEQILDQPFSLVVKELDVDQLVEMLAEFKEEIARLRSLAGTIEHEIGTRLTRFEATELRGNEWRAWRTFRREPVFEQSRLAAIYEVAKKESKAGLFDKAFPVKREVRKLELNKLMRLGGETARQIEEAQQTEKEIPQYKFAKLSSTERLDGAGDEV